MPNIKSAVKRMELSRRQQERNRAVRSRLRTAIRKVRAATDAAEGETQLRAAAALLDRAAQRNVLHRKTVDRIKSKLARRVGALQ
jgi:small subunit ribosomal protein S20